MLIWLAYVELCMELFNGKSLQLSINLMQVVTIYCIDIFTKYYKVKHHSNSPYCTGLHTGKTKYLEKHLLLSLVLEIYTNSQHLKFSVQNMKHRDVPGNIMRKGFSNLCRETRRSMKCSKKTTRHRKGGGLLAKTTKKPHKL